MPIKRKSMARPGMLPKKSFLDSSDEEVPAPETPAKAPRLEAPVRLPAATLAQFRSEAQRLVINTEDLGALSQGAARENLEGRLGLEPGTFNSSRRMRQWACEVLQGEVDKRALRSARVNQIAQALCDVEDYPLVCRRMLIEALPFATACPNGFGELVQPHAHQVRILDMVREVLQESQLGADRAASEASTAAASAVDSHDQREANSTSAALARANQTRAIFEAKSEALRDAKGVEHRAQEDLALTKEKIKDADQNMSTWKQLLSLTRTVRNGFFLPLKDGTCPDSAAKEQSLDSLCRYLEDEAQQTLAHAARMALVVEPADRTNFLQIVVGQLGEFFDGNEQTLASKIAEAEYLLEPSTILKEEAVCEAAVWNTAQRMLDLADAKEKHQDAEEVCRVERSELDHLHKVAMDFQRTAVDAEARSAVFVEALSSIDELSQCTEVPAPSTDRPCPGAEQVPGEALGDIAATPGPADIAMTPGPADIAMTPGPAATPVELAGDSVEQEGLMEEVFMEVAAGITECNSQDQKDGRGTPAETTEESFAGQKEESEERSEVALPCSGSSVEEPRNIEKTDMMLPASDCVQGTAGAASAPPSPCEEAARELTMTPRKSKEGVGVDSTSSSPLISDVPTPQRQRRKSLP